MDNMSTKEMLSQIGDGAIENITHLSKVVYQKNNAN